MADSDEYDEDSFELDEIALASIQATEERFGVAMSQAQTTRSEPSIVPPTQLPRSGTPPSKRLKTTHDWIQPAKHRGASRAPVHPSLQRVEDDPEIFVSSDGSYVLNVGAVSNAETIGHKGHSHGHVSLPHSRGLPQQQDINSIEMQAKLDPHIPPAVLRPSFQRPTSSLKGYRDQRRDVVAHLPPKPHFAATKPESMNLQTELDALRAQLSELTSAHAMTKQSLRETQDVLFSKAGEVSNLRRTIDKTAREHTEAMAKLKEEKEATENIKTELQAKLKEETDRLTTRLELGTGVVRQPIFKGFQNAFTDSAPVLTRSPMKGVTEGRKQDDTSLWHGQSVELDASEDVSMSVDGGSERMEHTVTDQEALKQVDQRLSNVSLQRIDLGEELRRIVFSHIAPGADILTLQLLVSTSLPEGMPLERRRMFASACQMVIETCGVLPGHPRFSEDSEWEALVVNNVASAFVIIGGLLSDAGCVIPLVALLELMTMLTLYIPTFLLPLIGPADAGNILGRELDLGGPSQLLSMLENVVQDHIAIRLPLHSKKAGNGENITGLRVDLAMVVVQLMESLYWNIKERRQQKLEMTYCRSQVLDMLLHAGQPPKLIERTLRLLVLTTTYSFTFRETPAVQQAQLSLNERSHVTLVEQLCQHIIYPPETDCHSIQRLIITVITILRNIHTDASILLLDCVSLVPSVILCITRLCRLLWEDDIDVMGSSDDAKLIVETLYLWTNFLHDLVFTPKTSVNLSHKLMEVTHMPGPFNGMTHMFMVTFGRLSWAEAPDWLDNHCKGICEIIAELAMEVIETVVAGPECDTLWTVWHPDEELDDEEVEAQRIHIE